MAICLWTNFLLSFPRVHNAIVAALCFFETRNSSETLTIALALSYPAPSFEIECCLRSKAEPCLFRTRFNGPTGPHGTSGRRDGMLFHLSSTGTKVGREHGWGSISHILIRTRPTQCHPTWRWSSTQKCLQKNRRFLKADYQGTSTYARGRHGLPSYDRQDTAEDFALLSSHWVTNDVRTSEPELHPEVECTNPTGTAAPFFQPNKYCISFWGSVFGK